MQFYRKFTVEAIALVERMLEMAKEGEDALLVEKLLARRLKAMCEDARDGLNNHERFMYEQALGRLRKGEDHAGPEGVSPGRP